MSKTQMLKLSDIFPISMSGEWGSDPKSGGNSLVLRAADFTKDCKLRFEIGAPRTIPIEKLGVRVLKEGDILIEKSGGSPNQPVGRVVYFNRGDEGRIYSHSNFLQLLRVMDGFNAKYAYYLMAFLYERGVVYRYQQQTTGIINLKLEHYLKEEVEIPASSSERRFVEQVLSEIDITIEKTEALITKYQQVKTGLMHDLFTRGITVDGKLRPSREQAQELYYETIIGWIPKEWGTDKFGENIAVIDPNPSHRYPAELNEGYPICSTENFSGENGFAFKKSKLVSESTFQSQQNRCQFKENDVVFARKGKLGLARRYGKDKKVFSHTVVLMKPSTKQVDANWLLWLSRSHWLLKAIDVTMNTNSGVPTLGVEFIKGITVPFPEIGEQKLIDQSLNAISNKIEIEVNKREKLLKQKSGLMRDLLTGRVRVSLDEERAHV